MHFLLGYTQLNLFQIHYIIQVTECTKEPLAP